MRDSRGVTVLAAWGGFFYRPSLVVAARPARALSLAKTSRCGDVLAEYTKPEYCHTGPDVEAPSGPRSGSDGMVRQQMVLAEIRCVAKRRSADSHQDWEVALLSSQLPCPSPCHRISRLQSAQWQTVC